MSRHVIKTFYTAQEIADQRRIDVKTVYRHVKAGQLRAHRYGRAMRITAADAAEWDKKCCLQEQQGKET